MNKRKIISFVLFLAMAFTPFMSIAKSDESNALPENGGTYGVTGSQDLMLRVIVQKASNPGTAPKDKQPSAAPQYVCGPKATLDKDSAAVVGAAGWKLPGSWTYRIDSASVPSTIGAAKAGTLIGNAFNAWQSQLPGKVSFARGADIGKSAARMDGQNIVKWGRLSASALAVSYVWYDESSGMAIEIDTVMNSRYPWYWSDPTGWKEGEICAYQDVYDAQNILTHEIGHSIGLEDQYDGVIYGDNTMYGYGFAGDAKADTLTTGDILGMRTLYGL